ncbi:MAG: metallophosphoesterase [Ruminiclostridium sp.]|nr:metallophosphoesterase [Ruminiclostridium sp.]
MLIFTGDTHGDMVRFVENNMNDKEWTENDTLIICGDFGYIFKGNNADNVNLDFLATKPYTICFCDGNHENFPALFSYPEEIWNGGRVHRIRKNIIHLMRGQIFEIDGKKLFSMGGAYSIDRYMRKLNISYWKEEIPTDAEYKEATENLKKHGKSVDIVISHTAPREIIKRMGYTPDVHDMELTGYLEWVMYEVDFKRWFFGHWHEDKEIDERFRAVYYDVITLE